MEHNQPDNELIFAYSLAEKPAIELETVKKAMQGDKEAFSTLFMQTYRTMFLVVRRFLERDEDIYDALQNGYTKAYKYLPRLQAPEAFLTWLKKTMENAARDVRADITGLETAYEDMAEFADELTVEYAESAERRADIQEVLSQLEPQQAEVLTLYYYDGMKLSEIAKLLDEPQSTVRSRFAQAKKTLVEQLKVKGIDKSLYSGSVSAMIAVCLRSLISTDVLSAATAQQMLDDILSGRQGRLGAAAYKLLEARRNRAILKAVSLLMALTVAVSCITVALLNGLPWKWFSPLAVTGQPDISGSSGWSISSVSSNDKENVTTASSIPSASGRTTVTSYAPISSDPSMTEPGISAPTTTSTTSPADTFIPDYAPGQANTVGNTPNNVSRNRGFAAKQADWLYFSEGNGYRVLMKMKIDGVQKQFVAESNHGFEYINVIGDWIYYCGSGIWRIRTDGSDNELVSALNARHLQVIGDTGYFTVETNGYTIYKIDLPTKKTTKIKNVTESQIAVKDDRLLYRDQFQLWVLNLKTNISYPLATCIGDFLVYGDRVYFMDEEHPNQLVSADYTNMDFSVTPLASISGSLLFVSPYQGGIIGYWTADSGFGCPKILSLSGKTLEWKSTLTIESTYNFYIFDDDYVYFYTPELLLHRARADGSNLCSFS